MGYNIRVGNSFKHKGTKRTLKKKTHLNLSSNTFQNKYENID